MQEDIERGGMAAYISEIAIDAALMDVPHVNDQTNTQSAYFGEEAGGKAGAEDVRMNQMLVGLPYDVEEFVGQRESHSLMGKDRDVE